MKNQGLHFLFSHSLFILFLLFTGSDFASAQTWTLEHVKIQRTGTIVAKAVVHRTLKDPENEGKTDSEYLCGRHWGDSLLDEKECEREVEIDGSEIKTGEEAIALAAKDLVESIKQTPQWSEKQWTAVLYLHYAAPLDEEPSLIRDQVKSFAEI